MTMPAWKQALTGCYYYTTLPYRRWRNYQYARAGNAPVSILFYHRIADEYPNAWTMPTEMFRRQVEWLEANFDIISLAEAQKRLTSGFNDRPAACITFDDGYAENCAEALPLLIRKNLPATYFVTTGNVLSREPFPHDVKAGRPLEPNTIEQLRALAAAGVEIGAHTRTHPDLGKVTCEHELFDETIAAARDLENVCGCDIRYFAFPFGLKQNLNDRAIKLLRDNGFDGFCSAYGGYNFPGDFAQADQNAFHLQRIHADVEFIRLKNWLTGDPRKFNLPRYQPGEIASPAENPAVQVP